MITGTSDKLTPVAETHVCAEHGTPLTVAWLKDQNTHVLRCGKGHYPIEVTRAQSLTEAYRSGSPEEIGQLDPRVPDRDLETGSKLTPAEISLLLGFAEVSGLDAYRGHVCMMYGRPYPTLEGLEYRARNLKVPYSRTGRPLEDRELLALGYLTEDIGWLSTVTRLDTGEVFEGLGFVTMAERAELSKRDSTKLRSPVVAAKWGNMVVKRAEWQAMTKAFPLGADQEKKWR